MRIKLHHLLIAFLIFTLCTSLIRNGGALWQNRQFFGQLKSEYEREKIKNDKLKLNAAKSGDPFELERIVRDKLGFVKDGEQIIIIPTLTLTPTPTP